jgi:hypothetical protein
LHDRLTRKNIPLASVAISDHMPCPSVTSTAGEGSRLAMGIYQTHLPMLPTLVVADELTQRFLGSAARTQ